MPAFNGWSCLTTPARNWSRHGPGWGRRPRYIFVAADVYRLPFIQGLFDAATMIRVLHHMAEPLKALGQVRDVLQPGATFVLEFANKRNLKSVLRYWMGRQEWNPFSPEPVEFASLNYDFHPRQVQAWCEQLGFRLDRKLTVSHFRSPALKRLLPVGLLTALDALLQPTGSLWQLTPSVFYRLSGGTTVPQVPTASRRCPSCSSFAARSAGTRHSQQELREPGLRRVWTQMGSG